MKVLIEYNYDEAKSVEEYIFINGNDPDRYFRKNMPHPLNKFISIKMNYKEPKIKRKKRTSKVCV